LSALLEEASSGESVAIEVKSLFDALSIVYDAIQSTVGGIIITNMEGRITYVNPSFLKMFGFESEDQVLGRDAADLFLENHIKGLNEVSKIIMSAPGDTSEFTVLNKEDIPFDVEVSCSNVTNQEGVIVGKMASFVNISRRKKAEREKEELIGKLQESLAKIKALRGLLPICASCKNIRDDSGYWHQVETYIKEHSEANFTHSICPECTKRLYPNYSIMRE
jgi:PAS domain S-box-containing protein